MKIEKVFTSAVFQLPSGRLGLRHWRKVHLNTNCPSRSAKFSQQKTITQIVQETITHCKYLFIPNVTMMGCSVIFVFSRLFSVHANFMHTEFQGPLTSPQFCECLGNFVENITQTFVTSKLCIIYTRNETNWAKKCYTVFFINLLQFFLIP